MRYTGLVVMLGLSACSESSVPSTDPADVDAALDALIDPVDGGARPDARPADARAADAGSADANPQDAAELDSAVPDASEPDMSASEADAALPDATPPDAGEPGETCDVFVAEGDRAPFCQIPVDTPFACLHLARCLCAVADFPVADVESCAVSQITPRGAITLADFCFADGISIGQVIERAQGLALFAPPDQLRGSAACDALPAIADPQRAQAMQVCPQLEGDDPHVVADAAIRDGQLEVTVTAPELCERDWLQPCWTGTFDRPSGATLAVRYQRSDGDCEPLPERRVSAPAYALHPAHDFYRPGVGGALSLRLRPWVRTPGSECSSWLADEPCVEAACAWTGALCETPYIDLRLPR